MSTEEETSGQITSEQTWNGNTTSAQTRSSTMPSEMTPSYNYSSTTPFQETTTSAKISSTSVSSETNNERTTSKSATSDISKRRRSSEKKSKEKRKKCSKSSEKRSCKKLSSTKKLNELNMHIEKSSNEKIQCKSRETILRRRSRFRKFEVFHICIGMIAISLGLIATIIFLASSNYDFLAIGTGVWAGAVFTILGGIVIGLANKSSLFWKILLYFCIVVGLGAAMALCGTEIYAALKSYWIITNNNDWVFNHRNYPVVRTTTFLIVVHCMEATTGLAESIVCIAHIISVSRSRKKYSTTTISSGTSRKSSDGSTSRKSTDSGTSRKSTDGSTRRKSTDSGTSRKSTDSGTSRKSNDGSISEKSNGGSIRRKSTDSITSIRRSIETKNKAEAKSRTKTNEESAKLHKKSDESKTKSKRKKSSNKSSKFTDFQPKSLIISDEKVDKGDKSNAGSDKVSNISTA